MRFIYHLFGTLFFIVWTAIGLALIAGVLLLFSAKPWESLSGLMPGGKLDVSALGGVMKTMGQAGDIGDLVQKMSAGKDVKEEFISLPKEQQDCLYKELGEKTVNDALAGKIQPTPDLIFKGMKCMK